MSDMSASDARGPETRVVHYSGLRLVVAVDVGYEICRAATEFGNAGQLIALPVACYLLGKPTTVTMVVGVGVPLLVSDAEVGDPLAEPPETLRSWEWIKSHTDCLQSDVEV